MIYLTVDVVGCIYLEEGAPRVAGTEYGSTWTVSRPVTPRRPVLIEDIRSLSIRRLQRLKPYSN